MNIIVLTTTYNRAECLKKLHDSLKVQDDLNFKWFIVDDGSSDNTEEVVEVIKKENSLFPIDYYKKENGGKSRTLNYAFSRIGSDGFVIIIDDDEILYSDAISNVRKYAIKYKNTNCGGMEFLRNNLSKEPIANYKKEDFFMSVQERKRKGLEIDGYAGYYLDKIKGLYFPEFEKEKYVGPGVFQMLVGSKYELLWPNVALGETEYLPDGISKSGRKLRLKNPKGMIYYCSQLQDKKSGFKIRAKYSIMGYAYIRYSRLKIKALKKENVIVSKFIKICYFPGALLALIWRIKY